MLTAVLVLYLSYGFLQGLHLSGGAYNLTLQSIILTDISLNGSLASSISAPIFCTSRLSRVLSFSAASFRTVISHNTRLGTSSKYDRAYHHESDLFQ